jgi:transposase
VHKVAGVQEAIEAVGAAPLYLPPYSSPDVNPIEMAFSKFKALLRKAGERAIPGLLRRIGRIVKSFRSHRMQQIPEPRRLRSDMTGIRSHSSLCVADRNDGVTR